MIHPRQAAILDFIKTCPIPPTLREIGDATGISSTSMVSHHLEQLHAAGLVVWDRRKARTISVPGHTPPAAPAATSPINRAAAARLAEQQAEINRLNALVEALKADVMSQQRTIEAQRRLNEMLNKRLASPKEGQTPCNK